MSKISKSVLGFLSISFFSLVTPRYCTRKIEKMIFGAQKTKRKKKIGN
jgi:hypothetical protein